jgi:hypothetical protein
MMHGLTNPKKRTAFFWAIIQQVVLILTLPIATTRCVRAQKSAVPRKYMLFSFKLLLLAT